MISWLEVLEFPHIVNFSTEVVLSFWCNFLRKCDLMFVTVFFWHPHIFTTFWLNKLQNLTILSFIIFIKFLHYARLMVDCKTKSVAGVKNLVFLLPIVCLCRIDGLSPGCCLEERLVHPSHNSIPSSRNSSLGWGVGLLMTRINDFILAIS